MGIKVQVVMVGGAANGWMPQYMTSGAAGADLRAALSDEVKIAPLCRVAIPTGIALSIPEGYEAQVRPRSGLAAKNGITLLNSPGTIDSDYRGEVKVLLINLGSSEYTVRHGDRIAQMVINKVERAEFEPSEELDGTARGSGGFGHTG